MSWFIGVHKLAQSSDLSKIHNKSNILHSHQIGEFSFQAGGIPETCRYLASADQKMVVLGLPIISDSLQIISEEELMVRLKTLDFSNLTGAYTLIIFSGNKIRVICDNLNFRKIYYYQQENEFILCTDLVWIKALKNLAPDLDSFGIYWNLGHSNGDKSLFEDVKTINSEYSLEVDEHLRISRRQHEHSRKLPAYNPQAKEIIKEKLSLFIKNLQPKSVSLSFSGGLDSRTILALLLQNKNEFITHTFGEASNYDVIIAKQIAKEFEFLNIQYDESKKIDKNSFVEQIKLIARETEMTQSLLSFPLYGFFQDLYPKTDLMIDGGFICYLRKVTNNKILMFNQHNFHNQDIEKIYLRLKLAKPDVFFDENNLGFANKAHAHLGKILEEYKITENKDLGDWLDLIKFRVMNSYYFAPSQRKYDEFIPNVMIGAQDFFTNLIFSIPPKQRKNYKINLEMIKDFSPKLKNIPYARYNSFVKRLTTVHLDYLQAKINQKLGNSYSRSDNHYYLSQLEEWLFDSVNSTALVNSDLLDQQKIAASLHRYYKLGEVGQANNIMKIVQLISFLGD